VVASSISVVGAAPIKTAGWARTSARTSMTRGKVVRHCFGLLPNPQVEYRSGCQGHDEPDIAPISSSPNTAQDLAWTIVLPKDGTGVGARRLIDLGPTIWFGAAVQDPTSLYGQAFEELQFYPDEALKSCFSDGSYSVSSTPNKFGVCAPVWAVNPTTFDEYAAFNAPLVQSGTSSPIVLNAGDTVTVHLFAGAQAGRPLNILVSDVSTGKESAPIVVIGSHDGPLAPLTGTNTTSNFMQWGETNQAPFSLSWEIGHPNSFEYPNAPECVPGMFNCYSYSVTQGWAHAGPLKIKQAVFANGVAPSSWSVSDGEGARAEVTDYCGVYNAAGSGGMCTFPSYSYNGKDAAIEFGSIYPGTKYAYNGSQQFSQTTACDGPVGPETLYCAATLSPKPPIP
jgi:hypothetical protein